MDRLLAQKPRTKATNLSLPGSSGSGVTAPDSVALSIVGDIDLRARLAMTDWTPAAESSVLNKWEAAGTRSYSLAVFTDGKLRYRFTTDGTTAVIKDSTTPTGFTDGTRHWVRVTHDVDNGAAGHDIKFWIADGALENPVAADFTQLGATVTTATATSIHDNAGQVSMGGTNALTGTRVTGFVYAGQIRDGIDGTLVADPTFSSLKQHTRSFVDTKGNVWTVKGAAVLL